MGVRVPCALLAVLFSVTLAAPDVHITSISKPDGCDKARTLRAGQGAGLVMTGWIEESGVKFTEYNASRKMETVLGKDPLLKGLHKGLEGMCIGEKRTIVVPPELAHGDKEMRTDFATIPPNSALRFQVELSAVGTRSWYQHGKPVNIFKIMDTDGDGKLTTAEFTTWFEKQGSHPPADLFKREDKDDDGFIALAEFSGPKGLEAPEAAALVGLSRGGKGRGGPPNETTTEAPCNGPCLEAPEAAALVGLSRGGKGRGGPPNETTTEAPCNGPC